MPDKFIQQVAGVLTEKQASNSSVGATDAGRIVALNAQGVIDTTMLPPGLGAAAYSINASQNLVAGDFVSIHDDAGTSVRKAEASGIGLKAHGYVLEAVLSGANALVYTDFYNDQLSGLTPGVTYFLSPNVPGQVTATAPSGTGEIVQRLGVAISPTRLDVEMSQPIVLA